MDYNEYLKPELLIMIPVLNVLGVAIKYLIKITGLFSNKHIPLILLTISIILSCIFAFAHGAENTADALFTGIVQGILSAGTAVFGNQVFKQYNNKDE